MKLGLIFVNRMTMNWALIQIIMTHDSELDSEDDDMISEGEDRPVKKKTKQIFGANTVMPSFASKKLHLLAQLPPKAAILALMDCPLHVSVFTFVLINNYMV